MNLNLVFKDRVVHIMQEKNLTLTQVAKNAQESGFSLHKTYVNKVVTTEPCTNVTLDKVIAFSAGLKTSPYYLLGVTDNPIQKTDLTLIDKNPESVDISIAINLAIDSFETAIKNVQKIKASLDEESKIDVLSDMDDIKAGMKIEMLGKLTGNYLAAAMEARRETLKESTNKT